MSKFFKKLVGRSDSTSKTRPSHTRSFSSNTEQQAKPQPNTLPPYSPVAPTGSTFSGGGAADSYHYGDSTFDNIPMPLQHRDTLPLPSTHPSVPLEDDPYNFLTKFDTHVVIDDSGSMSGPRWKQTGQAISALVPIITYYDRDGIDLHFLNQAHHPLHDNITLPAQVYEIFSTVSPRGATPTGQCLNGILKPYMEKLTKASKSAAGTGAIKPLNIIVITDGIPTDDVESVIVQTAKKLDKLDADLSQIGIQFFQVGDDAGATEALTELDDVLKTHYNVRDMVDTVPWNGSLDGDRMLKVVLGAVNRRLDRRPA